MLVGKQGAFCPECEPEAGTAPRAQPEGEPEPIIKGIDNIRRHLGLPASPPEPVASTALDVLEAGMMFVATSKTPETKLKNLYATIVNVRSALRNLQVYEEAGPPPLTREQADAVVALVDAGLKGERRLFAMLHGGNRKREDIKRAVAAWQDAVAVPALRSALATLRGEA